MCSGGWQLAPHVPRTAPVLSGAPLTREDPTAGLPDLAVADAGVPRGAGVARLVRGEAISSVGATADDREEAIASAPG